MMRYTNSLLTLTLFQKSSPGVWRRSLCLPPAVTTPPIQAAKVARCGGVVCGRPPAEIASCCGSPTTAGSLGRQRGQDQGPDGQRSSGPGLAELSGHSRHRMNVSRPTGNPARPGGVRDIALAKYHPLRSACYHANEHWTHSAQPRSQ